MARSKNAKIQMESGRTLVSFAKMTDAGDGQFFNPADAVMSGLDGFAPDIRPNGIVTGRNLAKPAVSGTDNLIDIAAFTAYSKGALQTVVATVDEAITRAATDVASISSVTMTDAGIIAVIQGVDSLDATFSEVRGDAGAPPLIPVDSVEQCQIRTTSNAAAAIVDSEVFQNVGQHAERFDFPIWETFNLGKGIAADTGAEINAHIKMNSAMPAIHTGAVAKAVWAEYYVPTFADLTKTSEFVPAELTFSVSSTEFYGGSIASSSESLGQAAFTALLEDGVNDAEVAAKGQITTFKFFPNRSKTAFILTQGIVGIGRTFPVADQIQAAMTVTSESPSAEFSS